MIQVVTPCYNLLKRPGFCSDPTEGESEHAQEVQAFSCVRAPCGWSWNAEPPRPGRPPHGLCETNSSSRSSRESTRRTTASTGVQKMHHAMTWTGWQIGRDHLSRLMNLAGVEGVRLGRKPITTRPAGVPDHRPEVMERKFTAERSHHLWVADITYVRILAGFCLSRIHHRRALPSASRGGPSRPRCTRQGCRCSRSSMHCWALWATGTTTL